MANNRAFAAILTGSDSDLPVKQSALDVYDTLGVKYEVGITSARRTPEAIQQYVKDAEARGCNVFLAAVGLAAHLAGANAR